MFFSLFISFHFVLRGGGGVVVNMMVAQMGARGRYHILVMENKMFSHLPMFKMKRVPSPLRMFGRGCLGARWGLIR